MKEKALEDSRREQEERQRQQQAKEQQLKKSEVKTQEIPIKSLKVPQNVKVHLDVPSQVLQVSKRLTQILKF